jgi:hypothetical protein
LAQGQREGDLRHGKWGRHHARELGHNSLKVVAQGTKERGKDLYEYWIRLKPSQVPFALLPEVTADRIHVQFTRTHHSFYIISLKRPTTPYFEIDAPLPILENDRIRLLGAKPVGGGKDDGELEWRWRDGVLTIEIGEEALDEGEGAAGIAWVFEVEYVGKERPGGRERIGDEL